MWENGVELLDARLEKFSTAGELLMAPIRQRQSFPNHCRVNFPSTTHRLRLLWDGGVSLDGRRPITPDRTDLFRVKSAAGIALPAEAVLGLADLGRQPAPSARHDRDVYAQDGDNYLDICLGLSTAVPLPAVVEVVCDSPETQISMPKGLNRSPVYAPRAPPLCKPHAVNVSHT